MSPTLVSTDVFYVLGQNMTFYSFSVNHQPYFRHLTGYPLKKKHWLQGEGIISAKNAKLSLGFMTHLYPQGILVSAC